MASKISLKKSCSNFYVKDATVNGFAQVKNDFAFIVEIFWSNGQTTYIKRTYNHFITLQSTIWKTHSSQLRQLGGVHILPYLKGKSFFRRNTPELCESREPDLNGYLKKLISLPRNISGTGAILAFFESWPSDPKPSEPNSNFNTNESSRENSPPDQPDLEDFFFDMDISQIMLSSDSDKMMSLSTGANDYFREQSWSGSTDSLQMQRFGSEPTINLQDNDLNSYEEDDLFENPEEITLEVSSCEDENDRDHSVTPPIPQSQTRRKNSKQRFSKRKTNEDLEGQLRKDPLCRSISMFAELMKMPSLNDDSDDILLEDYNYPNDISDNDNLDQNEPEPVILENEIETDSDENEENSVLASKNNTEVYQLTINNDEIQPFSSENNNLKSTLQDIGKQPNSNSVDDEGLGESISTTPQESSCSSEEVNEMTTDT